MITPAKFLKDQIYRRASRLSNSDKSAPQVNGQLISLADLSRGSVDILSQSNSVKGMVVINFPSMPDTIDLVRRANYDVITNWLMPDGFHQYKNTDPLEIPFEFELHAFDSDYCPQGGLTLLDIAAKLQALTLPIGDSSRQITTTAAGPASGMNDAGDDAKKLADAKASANSVTFGEGAKDAATSTSFPVACLLDLIYAGSDAPGIKCYGYVKDVSVSLKGPWLIPPGTTYKNLPTKAIYKFTFVHRPSHTNKFSGSSSSNMSSLNVNAYADDVKNKLFNTVSLINGQSYRGFKED